MLTDDGATIPGDDKKGETMWNQWTLMFSSCRLVGSLCSSNSFGRPLLQDRELLNSCLANSMVSWHGKFARKSRGMLTKPPSRATTNLGASWMIGFDSVRSLLNMKIDLFNIACFCRLSWNDGLGFHSYFWKYSCFWNVSDCGFNRFVSNYW